MNPEPSPAKIFLQIAAAAFLARALVILLDPISAFGLALGWSGFFIVFGTLLLAVAAAAFSGWLVLPGYLHGGRLKAAFAIFTLVASVPLHYALIRAADADWNASHHVASQQIEYFCLKKFHRQKCVDLVNSCPTCVLEVDRWKRDIMADKLKGFRVNYPRHSAANGN